MTKIEKLIDKYTNKIINDLNFCAPEMRELHISNRLDELIYEIQESCD